MKLIRNNTEFKILEKIKEAEINLKKNLVYVLSSDDHLDHIAAYVAWKNVGGNIFVRATGLPKEQSELLTKNLEDFKYKNSIIFHTSGTTGLPKLVIHTEKQIQQSIKMSTTVMGWNKNTNFLNFIPPATSGFWHIILPTLTYHDCSIILGSKDQIENNFKESANLTLLVPSMIDQIRIRNIPIDFSRFEKVTVGASQVLRRHAEFCFNNGARIFTHMYGATEICSPILRKETNHLDDHVEYLEFISATSDSELMLVQNELWVKGQSVCENLKDFKYNSDEWCKTGDLFEQEDNLIRFIGRNNDIIKMNGYQCNLLLIEQVVEERSNLGESIAIPRNSLGVDWIELCYTNKEAIIDKTKLHNSFETILNECNIPKKYTYIESIPRNSLGKKMRNFT